MSSNSAIEWTDATWNPVTGCDKVSQGCKNCYAETWAKRHFGEFSKDHARKFTDVRLHDSKLDIPLRWKKPRRIFVTSMSDLFHEDVDNQFIHDVFVTMSKAKQHTFQILTKRPQRMLDWFTDWIPNAFGAPYPPLPNVWLGVSCEDQKTADERIPLLLQTPAAVRWVSAEPLLEPVDLGLRNWANLKRDDCRLDWLVVGGESGHGARPMHPDWVRLMRDDCRKAGVPFFFKQWGEYIPMNQITADMPFAFGGGSFAQVDDQMCKRVGKKFSGRLLDGREWNEYPQTAKATAAS